MHYWLSIAVALPVLLVIVTGLLLQFKKDAHWLQPAEQRGQAGDPAVSFALILKNCAAAPELSVSDWTDIARIDFRPDKSLLKVVTKNGWEAQLDPVDGTVLQVARRRSDLVEALHDGSWFGSAVKRWVFIPSGLVLGVLWATGLYLFLLPLLRRKRRHATQPVRADDKRSEPSPA